MHGPQAIGDRADAQDHHRPCPRLRQRAADRHAAAENREDRAEIGNRGRRRQFRLAGTDQIDGRRRRNVELQGLGLQQGIAPVIGDDPADVGREHRQHHVLAQLVGRLRRRHR